MATYQFSALSDGQAISFNPTADVLNFDQSAIAAADIRVTASGTSTRIDVIAGPNAGKDITLLNTTPFQLATSNVTFVDGSRLLFGDNSTATGDDNGNTLTGGTGRDLIFAFGGGDTINIGAANYGGDHIDGGASFDTLNFSGYVTAALTIDFAAGTISSSGGNATFANIERVIGGTGNDSIAGAAGSQNLTSGAGNDTVWGAGGVDTLWTGIGADVLLFREVGTANADSIGDFTSGTDKIALDASVMTALGASGNFAAGDTRFWAAAGAAGGHDADDRVVYNTTTRQVFYDADGNGSGTAQLIATLQSGANLVATDIVVQGGGSSGGQTINGTSGNDSILGTPGPDTINGLGGNDTLAGSSGNDRLDGGAGNDSLVGHEDTDVLIGGDGNDVLDGRDEQYQRFVEASETLDGGLGNDTFHVDSEGDVVTDSGGLDVVWAHDINWTLGAGFENLVLSNGASESLKTGIGNDLDNLLDGDTNGWMVRLEGRGGNDTILGSVRFDLLFGDDGNDVLSGGQHFDTLDGGAGNDILNGGMGGDMLTGGAGADRFIFDQSSLDSGDPDRITDFQGGGDKIRFDANAYTALGRSGNFDYEDARFYAAPGASAGHDADDRVVFNTSTGEVFYDPDGSGLQASRLIVTLQTGAFLLATDIAVDNGTPAGQVINGTSGNDSLVGTSLDDTINGLGGNDTLDGVQGSDSLNGGDGNDLVIGGTTNDDGPNPFTGGEDTLIGGAGDDTLVGISSDWHFATSDTLDGGVGNDVFEVDGPWDTVYDAGGVDLIIAYDYDWTLGAGFENLTLNNNRTEAGLTGIGNELDNVIRGGNNVWGGSILDGADGDDTLIGGPSGDGFRFSAGSGDIGNDEVHGGQGRDDTLAYWEARSAVVIDFRSGIATGGGNGGTGQVIFEGIEAAVGSPFGDQLIANDGVMHGDQFGTWFGGLRLSGEGGNDTLMGGAADDDLDGGTGDDTIAGNGGDDRIFSASGSDLMFGGSGNDVFTIHGSAASLQILGDAGQDRVVYEFSSSAVIVNLGENTLTGGGPSGSGSASISADDFVATSFSDRITGHTGANLLIGNDGNDTLDGGGGNDTLDGGTEGGGSEGADVYLFTATPGAANADLVRQFISGEDKIRLDASVMPNLGAAGNFSSGDARFYSAAGATGGHDADDRVIYNTSTLQLFYDADGSGAGAAQLIATFWNTDSLVATDIAVDSGTGGGGPLNGTAGNDSLTGTAGNDIINGLAGNDTLRGLGGDDTLDGGDGVDSLDGGLGNDSYVVTAGDVIVSDPGGIDTVFTPVSWNISSAAIENITMTGTSNVSVEGNNLANTIIGNDAPNYINARAGSDTLIGNGGNDTFNMSRGGTASFGNDSIDGGAGVDTVEFSVNALTGLVADFAAGTVTGGEAGGAGSSTILNIERFIAGDFNDVVTGSGVANYVDARAGNDTVNGAAGNDTLIGGTGNDRLAGGTGVDSMTGGVGLDSFVFAEAGTANADRITDFVSASDKIALDDAGFTSIGAMGNFAAGDGRFWAAAGATSGHDANDRVIYNTSTGSLYYDADGSGGGAALLIATFTGNPAVAATDITVI